ncbi:MAG: hypothetical protein JW902_03485, partial [Syntrophaceae bacterium]|nr:hypothetical protein [Syntrophaceae bacterium]
MRYQIAGLALALREGEDELKSKTAQWLNIPEALWSSFRIVRKSLDARRNRPPHFVYTVEIELP